MTHAFIPTQALVRPEPTADPDEVAPLPDLTPLTRAMSVVGVAFPAVGALLVEGWVSA